MKIGIPLFFYPGAIGGMENYVRELIDNFTKIDNGKNEYYLILSKFAYSTFKSKKRVHKIKVESADGDYIFLTKAFTQIIEKHKIDFWFCPLLDLFPKSLEIPSAVTIPDMQHEHYPQFFSNFVLSWRKDNFKASADLADVVFTISEFSKKDIAEKLHLNKNKIVSTYLDCSERFKKNYQNSDSVLKKYNIPEEYIFYPANFWLHKNHEILLKAVKEYKQAFNKNINLVFTGYDENNFFKIKKIVNKLGIKKEVMILGYVQANDLPLIYANAKALVFPSLFEGFGIPLLEAMWQNCPVLCSKNTSLPEVGRDAVLYINEHDPKDIAFKINEVIENPKIRNFLIKKSKKVRQMFSYEKCAKETLRAIESAVYRRKLKNKDLKVSIITPSYNQAQFLDKTIESVVGQKYSSLEYFIIDGGSTDGSVDMIKKYAKKYPFIKWISKKDNGQSEAINKGLKMCKGDIIAYLNSDDTYYPGAIKKVVRYFKNNDKIKIIYGEGTHIDERGREIERYNTFLFSESKLKHNCFICQPTLFMRKEVFKKVGFFNEKIHTCMDYEYWIRASKYFYFNYIPFKIATSRIHSKAGTITLRSQVFKDVILTIKKYYGYVPISWLFGQADYKLTKADQIITKKATNGFFLKTLTLFLVLKNNYKYPKKVFSEIVSIIKRD